MVYPSGFVAGIGHEDGEMVYPSGFVAGSGHEDGEMVYPSGFVAALPIDRDSPWRTLF